MPRATAALAHARACATPSRLCLYIYIENMVLQKGAVGVSNRVTVNVYANMSSNLFLLVLHARSRAGPGCHHWAVPMFLPSIYFEKPGFAILLWSRLC